MDNRKFARQILLFILVMALAFYTIFRGQDLAGLWESVRSVSGWYLMLAALCGVFFVSAEGMMIWYLLKSYGGTSGVFRCIRYSFIGFFYSGITPSATGGQPMQLYYMKKDGNSVADSTVVLMVVAAMYKFVLVIIGLLVLVIWNCGLLAHFGNYYWLFILGIGLNAILVAMILGVMLFPRWMIGLSFVTLKKLESWHWIKNADAKMEKVHAFVMNYQQAVSFLKEHPLKLLAILVVTVLQRCSVFFMTYLIYRGFGFAQASLWSVSALQASVYVAVDMLPVPGAQGITEMVFKKVFTGIIPEMYLMPVMLVTRGINFYFLLLVSMVISLVAILKKKEKCRKSV